VTDLLTLVAVLTICAYFVVTWWRIGHVSRRGVLVARYEPPSGLSPAMLRYVWKEAFDDRTFWAAVLSLVSKGLASLETSDGSTRLRPTATTAHAVIVPDEERILLNKLLLHHGHKGTALDMLDPETEYAATSMAAALRKRAVGTWFRDNREYVIPGALFSLVPLCLAAGPRNLQQWIALVAAFGIMAPGGFYLTFVLLRMRDLVRAGRSETLRVAARGALILFAIMIPCLAALVAGCAVLLGAFGWRVLVVAALMVVLDLAFVHFMKAPTIAGRQLLDEIAGFREFLRKVEELPMDRAEGPGKDPGTYEKYLPYAVALDVEQQWSDSFVAMTSTLHRAAFAPNTHAFYLGMWNDKPIEVVYHPAPNRYGRPW
jgi:hypothetical protein